MRTPEPDGKARKPPRSLEEKLPLGTGEFELNYSRARALSLFDDLPARMEGRLQGEGGRGAVVLRRFRAGDVICRQGDPGWTAFYLIGNQDLIDMTERRVEKADEADRRLAAEAPELLALPPNERRRRAEELERLDQDREIAALLLTSAGRAEPEELDALYIERAILDAGDKADTTLAARYPSLVRLDPAAKARHADEVDAADSPLAMLLRASSRAAEHRVRGEVSVARSGEGDGSGDRSRSGSGGGSGADRLVTPARAGNPIDRIRALLGIPQPGRADARDPGDVAATQVVGTLHEGELFGELSCLHHTPRSATVRALRDCYAIELLGHMLQLLLANKAFRAELDATYRGRTLGQALRATPLLAQAPDDVIELLRLHAALVSRAPGEVLFEEGDPSDCLYVIRSGTLKLLRRSQADQVLEYRSRGDVIGEHEIVTGDARGATCIAYEHPRDPTRPQRRLPPPVRLELIRIDLPLWREACERFPALLRAVPDPPARPSRQSESPGPATSRVDELGLMQGRDLMLIDIDRCTRCDDCVTACTEAHTDRVPRLALHGPRVDGKLVATSCRGCADAVCLSGCPVSAIHKGAAGQIVIERWCIGCGLCAAQCPYGAIQLRAVSGPAEQAEGDRDMAANVAVTCDRCVGLAGGPRCVSACAHDAVLRSYFAGPGDREGR